eukprot:260943_1
MDLNNSENQEYDYNDNNDEQQALAPNYNIDAENQGNISSELVAVELGAIGAKQMAGKIENQYNQDIQTQQDQHKLPETPSYCKKLYSWFPLRLFCFAGGVILVTATILDLKFNSDAFIQSISRIYLLLFGLIIMIIEAPTWKYTRFFQLKIFFWFRILSRMWGRAWFYLFITVSCFSE